MEKFDKSNQHNQNAKKSANKKKPIIIVISLLVVFLIFKSCFSSSSSATIGKYTKEELPKEFSYKITKDESDANVEKNQLYVEISEKLTVGQIATLAEELFETKDQQRRFYIGYHLKGQANNLTYWATSHFDPELEIDIIGSTKIQDAKMIQEAKKVNGRIIGIYDENEYTFSIYTIYEKDGKTHIKNALKNGECMDYEMIKTIAKEGIRLDYNDGRFNGEFYILNNQNLLEFYNKRNERFTTGTPLI